MAMGLMLNAGVAMASEVTGTLSNDPSQTMINETQNHQNQMVVATTNPPRAQGMEWNAETIIKTVIISLLVLEILALIILDVRRRRKLAVPQNTEA